MAAQLYANTQLALALYEVLQELVEEGKVPESLAVATLAQVGCKRHASRCCSSAVCFVLKSECSRHTYMPDHKALVFSNTSWYH
jgi:hypothetical protein